MTLQDMIEQLRKLRDEAGRKSQEESDRDLAFQYRGESDAYEHCITLLKQLKETR